jgi:hypothetical protein
MIAPNYDYEFTHEAEQFADVLKKEIDEHGE